MVGVITRWTHPDHPWLSVSPDAILVGPCPADRENSFEADFAAAVGLVEVKIPRGAWALGSYAPDLGSEDGAGYGIAATLADPDGPAVPRKYALQVLAQLGVLRACGAPVGYCDVWVWPGPHDHRRVRLLWDAGADAAFAALIAALADWRPATSSKANPTRSPAPTMPIAVRYWSAEGQHEAPGLAATAARYADLSAQIKALEAEQAAAKAILLTAAQRAGADRLIVPDPDANPLASKKADREGKPAKITIGRGLRVTPGWLADADPAALTHDPGALPEPIRVPGVTVAELRDDAADAADAPAAALPPDLPPPWPLTSATTGNRPSPPRSPTMTKKPDTIASLAKAIAKEAQAARPASPKPPTGPSTRRPPHTKPSAVPKPPGATPATPKPRTTAGPKLPQPSPAWLIGPT
jgi:hypothetical protein